MAEGVGVEPTLDFHPASLANLSRDRLSHPPIQTIITFLPPPVQTFCKLVLEVLPFVYNDFNNGK